VVGGHSETDRSGKRLARSPRSTEGAEIQKTRPCLVISPDEMNRHLRTVVVAPMTTVTRPFPTRVAVRFQGKRGQVALDQLRAVTGCD